MRQCLCARQVPAGSTIGKRPVCSPFLSITSLLAELLDHLLRSSTRDQLPDDRLGPVVQFALGDLRDDRVCHALGLEFTLALRLVPALRLGLLALAFAKLGLLAASPTPLNECVVLCPPSQRTSRFGVVLFVSSMRMFVLKTACFALRTIGFPSCLFFSEGTCHWNTHTSIARFTRRSSSGSTCTLCCTFHWFCSHSFTRMALSKPIRRITSRLELVYPLHQLADELLECLDFAEQPAQAAASVVATGILQKTGDPGHVPANRPLLLLSAPTRSTRPTPRRLRRLHGSATGSRSHH